MKFDIYQEYLILPPLVTWLHKSSAIVQGHSTMCKCGHYIIEKFINVCRHIAGNRQLNPNNILHIISQLLNFEFVINIVKCWYSTVELMVIF